MLTRVLHISGDIQVPETLQYRGLPRSNSVLESGVNGGNGLPQNPIIARRRAAATILDLVFAQGGGSILVDGLSGMGKTFFLRELAEQARQRDAWPVVFLNADRMERGEPYSFIERFFAAGVAPEWDFDPETDQQPLAIARDCVRHLIESSGDTPHGHFIVIDDAHWIDEASTQVLRHLIPRVNRRNVAIVCAARTPHDLSSIGQFLADAALANPQDQHVTIEPLTEGEILALALERFGMTISRENAAELQRVTGGSFLGVDSIFKQVTTEEIEHLHRTWEFPIRDIEIQNPLLREYFQLDPDVQALAQIVCLARHELPYETLLAATKRLGVPNTIAATIQAGLIKESGFGRSILPKHDLTAAAIRDTVDPVFGRQVHRVLAELTDGFRSVWHQFKGAETWDSTLQARVDEYVSDTAKRNQLSNTTEILRMSLDLAKDLKVRQQLITDLVLINIRARTGYRCLDLLDELESFPYSMLRECLVLMLRVYLVDEPYPEDRVEQVLRTPTRTPDEVVLQGFLLFTLIMVLMRSENRSQLADLLPIAKVFLHRGPQHPDQLHDPRLAWMVAPREFVVFLECLEQALLNVLGRPAEARNALPDLISQVNALPEIGVKIDCLSTLAGVSMATGDIAVAHDLAHEAIEILDRGATDSWARATPRIIQAHTLTLLGKYEQALESLDDFEEISHDTLDLEARLTGAALRAKIYSITGRGNPEPYLAQASRIWDFHWEHYGRDLSVMAKVEHARVNGNDQKILDVTARPEVQKIITTQRGFLTYRAHALLNLKKFEQTEALLAELDRQRQVTWYEQWGTLDWLHARLAQARGQSAEAKKYYESARHLQDFPLPWALTSLDYGEFLLGEQDVKHAEKVLRQAVETLEELGATAYLPRAKKLLSDTLEQHRQTQSDILDSMTQREREVAALLAEGHSNRAIAEQLVVSQSTARFHVSNILRKLGLNSRAEVARLLHSALTSKTPRNDRD